MSARMRYATVWLCLCLLCLVKAQLLQYSEGDVCKEVNGKKWTCKAMNDCSKYQEDLKKNITPTTCASVNNHPLICCEPPRKSRQMCEKYAESVYSEVTDPSSNKPVRVDSCAPVEPLLINGRRFAQPREYPHMALIGYGDKSIIQWLSGGSLISDRYILTTASSTASGSLGKAKWARLGEYNKMTTRDNEDGDAQHRDYEIIETLIHPNYSNLVYNDIALYKLKDTVEFNEYIRPICLNTERQITSRFAIATGWGRTEHDSRTSDILKKVNLTITTTTKCSEFYPVGKSLKSGIDDETMVCAGSVNDGWDTCKGDSGGPLQVLLKDPYCMYAQIGITSFGRICGLNYPAVYTRVSHFVEWIEGIVWP